MVYKIPDKLRSYYAVLITVLQTCADALAIGIAFWAGYYIYLAAGNPAPQTPAQYFWVSLVAAIAYVLIFRMQRLYEREISLLNVEETKRLFIANVWAALLVFTISFYVRTISLSRIMVTISIFGSFVFVYVERMIFYRMHLWLHERGFSQDQVLIYGAGAIGRHLARRLFQSPALGLLPIGFLDDQPELVGQVVTFRDAGPKSGIKILGGFDKLVEVLRSNQVREVFIAMPSATYEKNLQIINACRAAGANFSMVPPAYAQFVQRIQATEIGGIPILRMKRLNDSWTYRAAKRLLDFTTALVTVSVLSPLIVLFGILIKLDSRGPVIFKQKRVGLKGKEFSFYKFRTMHVESPKYEFTPRDRNDPRITRVGKWLRRTSLDELPQLFNVVRGDMSLVGPRPEMPFIVAQYNSLQRERLSVKPGITGVWQISCMRGDPIHENVEYDLYYIEHRSMLLDIVILIKTFAGVIRGIGAN